MGIARRVLRLGCWASLALLSTALSAAEPRTPARGGTSGRTGASSSKAPAAPRITPPQSASGWYTAAEMQNALQAANVLGRPVAFMYGDSKTTCPKCRGQQDAWLPDRTLTQFVRVFVETSDQQPDLFRTLRQKAQGKEGRFIPMLFLGSTSGEFLGTVPYATPLPQQNATVAEALKNYGPMLDAKLTLDLWTKLEQGQAMWEKGNTDAALRLYQPVKRAEKQAPKAPLFTEFKKEEAKVLAKGAEDVAAAKALFDEGKTKEARAAVAEITRRYVAFQTAEDAKALLKSASEKK